MKIYANNMEENIYNISSSNDLNSDALVEVFDELPLWSSPFGLKLLEKVKYRKGITALDIGCGTGFPLTEIAMRLGSSCKVYGLDPWDSALKRTEKKLMLYNISNIEIIRAFAECIPLDSSSIDLIISNNGLNNVADIEQSLCECSRVLKDGGQFLETRNLEGTFQEFYSVMKSVFEELNLSECIELMQIHIHKKRTPINKYLNLLRKHNLNLKSITYEQFDYRFTDGTAMLKHYFIRLAFLESWLNLLPSGKEMEIMKIIENRINEQSQENGLFIMSVPFAIIECEKLFTS
jgi:ubiquinone/menaquinone biosynthesis C-methylase UbiE